MTTTAQACRVGAGLVVGATLLAGVAILAQPRPPAPGSTRFPLPTDPHIYQTFEQKIRVTVVARGIERPWSLLPLITVGGAGRTPEAQAIDSIYGKVLRLKDDGTVPSDNPFVGRTGSRPEIYSIGHRDHHGIAANPTAGQIFHVELGPLGGDKINVLKAGGNYGWPTYGYGRDNNGSPMPPPGEGIEQAWITWNPGITPSGLLFYTGDRFPQWKGNIFVGSIQRGRIPGTGHLERLVFNDKLWEQRRESMLEELHQRVRDVRQGPDGLIYLLTEEDDGAVIKIEPES